MKSIGITIGNTFKQQYWYWCQQYFIAEVMPRPTQPSIPPGSVNEYQLQLGRQRQVWFIPLADVWLSCSGVCR